MKVNKEQVTLAAVVHCHAMCSWLAAVSRMVMPCATVVIVMVHSDTVGNWFKTRSPLAGSVSVGVLVRKERTYSIRV